MSRLCRSAAGVLAWALLLAVPGAQTTATPPQSTGVVIEGSVVDAALAALPGVTVTLEQAGRIVLSRVTDGEGKFRFEGVSPGTYKIRASLSGFTTLEREISLGTAPRLVQLPLVLRPVGYTEGVTVGVSGQAVVAGAPPPPGVVGGRIGSLPAAAGRGGPPTTTAADQFYARSEKLVTVPPYGGESYARIDSNRFWKTEERPLSTFGADVDTASYSNVRRFLDKGHLPPRDAVRVEELVNYFRFQYPEPRGPRPISVVTEVGECPWASGHKLVLIGAKARAQADREIAGRNLVLLIDVSGSMQPDNKLPLIKRALGMFVDTLRPDDRLAIVTYAGWSGIALPPTPARQRETIQRAIDRLHADGSTNGGEGLITAYRVARDAYVPGGVNRIILATDGDFNVGIVNQHDLVRLIEREKQSGVFLSVFGVGTGNLKDATMEMLADRGNGHYAYLDSLQEARRVLIREADATLETVAKDVKFQVEFNPATITAWKLIGYENRRMAPEGFNDDRKDGGELGAGHTVTVLYEIVPAGRPYPGSAGDRPAVDPLKYQTPSGPAPAPVKSSPRHAGELLTVKVRYKLPDASDSSLIEQSVRTNGGRARDLPFAAAVAEFGLLLRDDHASMDRWDDLIRRVKAIDAATANAGDRQSFVELVELAAGLRKLSRD